MRRSSFLTVEQLRVGAVVLVTLAILLYGGYRLGQQAHLFSSRYELVAFVPNASGLRAGGSVTVAGQLVGTVREVEFLAPDADTTKNLRLVLEVEEAVREQIRANSTARLRTQGLLGDKVFDISPGTTRYNVLAAGDTVPVVPSLDYDQIVQTASGAVDDLVGLTKDLREVSGGIARGEGTVGQLVTNRALYDELTETLDQTNRLIARLQSPNGTVGRLLDDPQLYGNLVRVTASVDSLTRAVATSQGTVGKLLTDTTLYARLVNTAASVDSLTTLLTRGNGLAAKLLTDQESYDRLNKTLTELNEILADVRRNPGRYTKGIIRVF